MLRTTLQFGARPRLPIITHHPIVALNLTRTMAEGSGASKAGGIVASGDAFSKREKANEDLAIKTREREKLLALREKLKQQQAHLAELDKHIDELTKDQGGEHN